jgi:hypothetical protein
MLEITIIVIESRISKIIINFKDEIFRINEGIQTKI